MISSSMKGIIFEIEWEDKLNIFEILTTVYGHLPAAITFGETIILFNKYFSIVS